MYVQKHKLLAFSAKIDIIGINPFVHLPKNVLNEIFKQAGKDKGPVRVRGTVNNHPYEQTLVKYNGTWRLYINTLMLEDSPRRIGEIILITIEYNPQPKPTAVHAKFTAALKKNKSAQSVFNTLSPSRQNEMIRYIANLKSKEAVERNINRAIQFLLGKDRFVGRAHP